LYGFAGSGWSANLSSIPGAAWIWAPGITGATTPAFPDVYFFSKAFNLAGAPTAGSISVAADDFAEVRVNGAVVGTIGSETDGTLAFAGQSSLTTFDITSFLVPGTNVITVRGANGNLACGPVAYNCNPAGVVFAGSLSFQPATDVSIDVKPGRFPNRIDLGKDDCGLEIEQEGGEVDFEFEDGVLPVAVLTTLDFDALTVDAATVELGDPALSGTAMPIGSVAKDVDHDGDEDLLLFFCVPDMVDNGALDENSTELVLTGETLDGTPITGRDSVRIVQDDDDDRDDDDDNRRDDDDDNRRDDDDDDD
jgi:hypothetical protein